MQVDKEVDKALEITSSCHELDYYDDEEDYDSDCDEYLKYDDFKPTLGQLKFGRTVHKSRFGVFTTKPTAITPKTSVRLNPNTKQELKPNSSKPAKARLESNLGAKNTVSQHPSKLCCVHSPYEPTDCRICYGHRHFPATRKTRVLPNTLKPIKRSNPQVSHYVPEQVKDKNCRCEVRVNPCQLDTPSCCACMDRRPHGSTYWAYLDGFGYCGTAFRSAYYCPACRDPFAYTTPAEENESADHENINESNQNVSETGNPEFADVIEKVEKMKVSFGEIPERNSQVEFETEYSGKYTKADAAEDDAGNTLNEIGEIDDIDTDEDSFDVVSVATVDTMSSFAPSFSSSTWSHISDDSDVKLAEQPKVTTYPKECGHDCALKQPKKCCSCADTRPVDEKYWIYVVRDHLENDHGKIGFGDGELLETRNRRQLYCAACFSK